MKILNPEILMYISIGSGFITIICVCISFWFIRKSIKAVYEATNSFTVASENLKTAGTNIENAFVTMVELIGKVNEMKKLDQMVDEGKNPN
jgi:hypothetical protein